MTNLEIIKLKADELAKIMTAIVNTGDDDLLPPLMSIFRECMDLARLDERGKVLDDLIAHLEPRQHHYGGHGHNLPSLITNIEKLKTPKNN